MRAGASRTSALALDARAEPDWLGAALPADEEWRIAWTKFYDGLDLAHAFARDRRRALPRHLGAAGRVLDPAGAGGLGPSDVAARRVQNWIYAWQRFAAAADFPGLATDSTSEIVRSIAEQAAYIRANLSAERNHRTLELYTLFLVALALPAADPSGELLARRSTACTRTC